MPSNFDFLKTRFPQLYTHASQVETLAYTAPRGSCFYARFTLEQAVYWLYDNDPYLRLPYDNPSDNSLGALIHEQTFKDNLSPGLFPKIRIIHKMGNIAAHDANKITERDSLRLTEELFHFLYWLARYYAPDGRSLPQIQFDRTLLQRPETQVPLPGGARGGSDLTLPQIQELEKQLSQADELRRIAEAQKQQTAEELTRLKAELDALKATNEAVSDPHDYNEADTRHYLIDVLLRESSWPIHQPEWTEYEVEGMPTPTGKGYVDYVLWGDDGKPLGLVEAKRTTKSPAEGKRQAELYANCLEAKYGQRPVIFYTNGYDHWIWDDCTYPPRQIQGFLKKDELERIIFRRTHRKKLHLVSHTPEIAGRIYQVEAIKRVTETFDDKRARKSLLVMATGTGKTRVSIGLVDVLRRANWAKRVLFLADRNALLTQAFRAFQTNLPSVIAVDLTQNRNDAYTADVVLSTYPTLFNAIDNRDGDARLFGPGHFDLLIVDEAHRSIYQKYQALFEYFDALLVGLTATPRTEIHRDTYKLFELEQGVPTFAYELEDAIKDGFLVPARGIDVPFRFLRRGLKYADLSPAEQEEYEAKFRDAETGEIPDEVNAAALNKWLFNIDTVDKALEVLMEQGLKVEGGDKLGKTIIFARNHNHAEFIVQRFDANYPHYHGKFAQVIDSHDRYAQSLLDDFSTPTKDPAIAVSVDMLDTGVDVPEVVNLMFFKPVYSEVKFNQMIGRGTRLCENLFGPDQPKAEFLIFDLCSNFEFFEQELKTADVKLPESLTAQLVKARLALSQALEHTDTPTPEDAALKASLGDRLHEHVASMARENFLVRRHLEQVEAFSERDRWETLSDKDREVVAETLATLPNTLPNENPLAKRFDLICLKLQIAILKGSREFLELRDKMRDLMAQLEEKRSIPMVQAKLPLISEVQSESWWQDVTVHMIERLRVDLRDLVQFIDRKQQQVVYTDFKDQLGKVAEREVPYRQTGFSPYQYRKKVEAYIRAHEDFLVIAKLKRNVPLTEIDLDELERMLFSAPEIESKERFEAVFGKDVSLKKFIRELVGLDRAAAKEAFAQYLEGNNLSANQIRFVDTIIDYLTQNGVMDPGLLYEPPFSDIHDEGLDGIFGDDDADRIIAIVRSFNETVGVRFGA